jgi:hypothetical protein
LPDAAFLPFGAFDRWLMRRLFAAANTVLAL